MKFWLPAAALSWRELARFYRDRSRVIGALVPPVIFWFLIGSGLGSSFRMPGAGAVDFLQYFFPGTLVLIVLFTSIFATISVIEDRKEGFLQSVLVSPAPRLSIVMGKVMGAGMVGFLQGMIFLVLAGLAGLKPGFQGYLEGVLGLFLSSIGLTALGFMLAWKLDSTQGFHAVMNLFLIPMWMLSGALFPIEGAPKWLEWTMRLNPVSYAVRAIQESLAPGAVRASVMPGLGGSLAILAVSGAVMLLWAARVAREAD